MEKKAIDFIDNVKVRLVINPEDGTSKYIAYCSDWKKVKCGEVIDDKEAFVKDFVAWCKEHDVLYLDEAQYVKDVLVPELQFDEYPVPEEGLKANLFGNVDSETNSKYLVFYSDWAKAKGLKTIEKERYEMRKEGLSIEETDEVLLDALNCFHRWCKEYGFQYLAEDVKLKKSDWCIRDIVDAKREDWVRKYLNKYHNEYYVDEVGLPEYYQQYK